MGARTSAPSGLPVYAPSGRKRSQGREGGRLARLPFCWRFVVGIGIALLSVSWPSAEAAYRLSFRNGTNVEVSSYEDLGEAVRYPRLGGTVTVPKAHLLGIEEVSHLPAPEKPAPQRPAAPSRPVPSASPPPAHATPRAAGPAPVPPPQGDPFVFVRPSLSILVPVFFVAFALLALAYALRYLVWNRVKPEGLPYTKVPMVLTAAEQTFYGVLLDAAGDRWTVLPKVRLSDVLDVPMGTPDRQGNRIDRKHLDFVLCSPADFAPLLAIELDDSSHDRSDRRRRDAFVDAALEAAGLPVLRISVRLVYDPSELRAQIDERLRGGEVFSGEDDVRL